jgi:hypothetical protein
MASEPPKGRGPRSASVGHGNRGTMLRYLPALLACLERAAGPARPTAALPQISSMEPITTPFPRPNGAPLSRAALHNALRRLNLAGDQANSPRVSAAVEKIHLFEGFANQHRQKHLMNTQFLKFRTNHVLGLITTFSLAISSPALWAHEHHGHAGSQEGPMQSTDKSDDPIFKHGRRYNSWSKTWKRLFSPRIFTGYTSRA